MNVENPGLNFSDLEKRNVEKTRLDDVRYFYFEHKASEDYVIEQYLKWVQEPEYLILKRNRVNVYTNECKSKFVLVKCAKRGNEVYARKVMEKMNRISYYDAKKHIVPELDILDNCIDFKRYRIGNRYYSNCLFVTLTYDRKFGIKECWNSVGKDLDNFLKYVKNYLGNVKLYTIRVFEAHQDLYPHIHLIVFSEKKIFTGFEFNGKIRADDEIRFGLEQFWGNGFIDVRIPNGKNEVIYEILKYLKKYIMKSVVVKEGEVIDDKKVGTLAMGWVFRKRLFSVSRRIFIGYDFIKYVKDVIDRLEKYLEKAGRKDYEIIGYYDSFEVLCDSIETAEIVKNICNKERFLIAYISDDERVDGKKIYSVLVMNVKNEEEKEMYWWRRRLDYSLTNSQDITMFVGVGDEVLPFESVKEMWENIIKGRLDNLYRGYRINLKANQTDLIDRCIWIEKYVYVGLTMLEGHTESTIEMDELPGDIHIYRQITKRWSNLGEAFD